MEVGVAVRHRIAKHALISLLLLLGACSSTTFIYNRLDFLLPWYLGDYTELNRSQKVLLDDLLQPYLVWHRMEELPRYLEILQQIELGLDEPLEQRGVAEISMAFEQAWSRLERESVAWMMELGSSLSDRQIAYFLAQLQKRQEEYEEEFLERNNEEYLEDTYDSLRDSFQGYLGRLDPAQKQALKNTSAAMLRSDSAWLDERAVWLLKLEDILQREPGWQQALVAALDARSDNVSPRYQKAYSHNLVQIQLAIIEVVNSRSEKQDRRLRRKLKNLQEDIETLIEQGEERRGQV
jgi:hypothetical protein